MESLLSFVNGMILEISEMGRKKKEKLKKNIEGLFTFCEEPPANFIMFVKSPSKYLIAMEAAS
jgi:hypothetical protein